MTIHSAAKVEPTPNKNSGLSGLAAQNSDDMQMIREKDQIIYATERGTIYQNACAMDCCTSTPKKECKKAKKQTYIKSTALVAAINTFGEQKGFEHMLLSLERKDTSFETMHNFIVFLAGATDLYHKSFVDKFLNRFN